MKTTRTLLALIVSAVLAGGAPAASPVAPEVEYFGLFFDGKKLGYALESRLVEKTQVTTTNTMVLTIRRGGVAITIEQKQTSIETPDGKPLSFTGRQEMSGMVQTVSGKLTGDGNVIITSNVGGADTTRTIPWPAGAVMSEGARLLTIQKGLAKGATYSIKLFDISMLQALDNENTVGDRKEIDLLGRPLTLTEIKTVASAPAIGKINTTGYVDDQYHVKKMICPMMGIEMMIIACPKDFALGPIDSLDFFEKVFVQCPSPLKGYRTAKNITYHIMPTGAESLAIPESDSQKVVKGAGKELLVTVRPAAAAKNVAFPYKGSDKELLAATRPSEYLQSDRKEVRELARRAAGSATDAATVARNIETFVRQYITKKDLSVGYASAVEVVQSRQGDCTEHAVLVAALLRAEGIPSKVVAGVVYIPRYMGKNDIMGPHAWARAYIGDRWIDLDAALEGFDAGHIALAACDGDPTGFFNTVTLLGCFKITRAEVEK